MRSARWGKCLYTVPMPTPAFSAISRTGASTPEVANTALAVSSKVSRLRCASARTRRSVRSRGARRSLSSFNLPFINVSFAKRNIVPYYSDECSGYYKLTQCEGNDHAASTHRPGHRGKSRSGSSGRKRTGGEGRHRPGRVAQLRARRCRGERYWTGRHRASVRRHGSDVDRRRGRAHPYGVWPPRPARQQRGHLEYGEAAGPVHRGVRQIDPPEQRVPR